MQKIIFFTTFSCHLCEKVEQMFSQYFHENSDKNNLQIELFDIVDDEKILAEFRTKIPVLKKVPSDTLLSWPFSYHEFCDWLEN